MTTDTKPFDLESLSLLSDEALDVIVCDLRGIKYEWENSTGTPIPFIRKGSTAYARQCIPSPSTDARAALLLLEEAELIFEPFITPKGTNLTVWNKREWFEGKPSVALPRAITIAYILFKQSQ
jgi:hypothetical protein